MSKNVKAFGSWKSPIGAKMMVSSGLSLSDPRVLGDRFFWHESRPSEQGRGVVVCREADGSERDLFSAPYSARSGVHEYGGRCYAIGGKNLYFVNSADQQIYSVALDSGTRGNKPVRLTPLGGKRFADLDWIESTGSLLAVCEDHGEDTDGEIITSIVMIEPSAATPLVESLPVTLVSGSDFYAYPRISPDQKKICWLEWNHPQLPWFATELCTADLNEGQLSEPTKVAGGNDVSIFQPSWRSNGDLFFCSDRNNNWNLYSCNSNAETKQHSNFDGECGLPLWQFGMQTYAFLGETQILCGVCIQGVWQLISLNIDTGETHNLESDLSLIQHIASDGESALIISASPTSNSHIWLCDQDMGFYDIKNSAKTPVPIDAISIGTSVVFDTSDSMDARGFFYEPKNPKFEGPKNEKPPLVVLCHGGPTAATSSALNLKVQFWTSRGFAVFDINYRGSTGYGRNYRNLLNGKWGIYDVEDACAAAKYACDLGWADENKTIIRGSSAGGFTVLSALTFHDTFKAGGCLYGIGDLKTLMGDTHKFEARYGDALIAPWPDGVEEYDRRSPINQIDQLSCPVIFFQGLLDKVVPPNQAQMMAEALAEKDIAVAHVTYDNEGHGFRSADTIVHSFNAELYFYGAIFGFSTDSKVTDLEILNLPSA